MGLDWYKRTVNSDISQGIQWAPILVDLEKHFQGRQYVQSTDAVSLASLVAHGDLRGLDDLHIDDDALEPDRFECEYTFNLQMS